MITITKNLFRLVAVFVLLVAGWVLVDAITELATLSSTIAIAFAGICFIVGVYAIAYLISTLLKGMFKL